MSTTTAISNSTEVVSRSSTSIETRFSPSKNTCVVDETLPINSLSHPRTQLLPGYSLVTTGSNVSTSSSNSLNTLRNQSSLNECSRTEFTSASATVTTPFYSPDGKYNENAQCIGSSACRTNLSSEINKRGQLVVTGVESFSVRGDKDRRGGEIADSVAHDVDNNRWSSTADNAKPTTDVRYHHMDHPSDCYFPPFSDSFSDTVSSIHYFDHLCCDNELDEEPCGSNNGSHKLDTSAAAMRGTTDCSSATANACSDSAVYDSDDDVLTGDDIIDGMLKLSSWSVGSNSNSGNIGSSSRSVVGSGSISGPTTTPVITCAATNSGATRQITTIAPTTALARNESVIIQQGTSLQATARSSNNPNKNSRLSAIITKTTTNSNFNSHQRSTLRNLGDRALLAAPTAHAGPSTSVSYLPPVNSPQYSLSTLLPGSCPLTGLLLPAPSVLPRLSTNFTTSPILPISLSLSSSLSMLSSFYSTTTPSSLIALSSTPSSTARGNRGGLLPGGVQPLQPHAGASTQLSSATSVSHQILPIATTASVSPPIYHQHQQQQHHHHHHHRKP